VLRGAVQRGWSGRSFTQKRLYKKKAELAFTEDNLKVKVRPSFDF
jgi:hypothetical protein